MIKSTFMLFTFIFAYSIQSWAFAPRPYSCYPRGEWRTVDTFIPSTDISAVSGQPRSAASNSKAEFVVGNYANRAPDAAHRGYRWVVRRSLNRGEIWNTADEFYVHAPQDTEALGVATNRINDDVYVVGHTLWQYEAYRTHGWIVRKSSDHGATWTTVDDFLTYGRGEPHARSISVGFGNIYAVGINLRSLDESIPRQVILRRSTDNGSTWETIDLTSFLSNAVSVTATADGSVFVTGKGQATGSSPIPNWVVIHSPNGKDSWKIVDQFDSGTEIQGSVASAVQSRVSVFGTSNSGLNWTVREVSSSSPFTWKTIDNYRPEVIDGKGSAIAGAATYSKAGFLMTGNLFVTGAAKNPLKSFPSFMTRRRLNPSSSKFVISEQFEEIYNHTGDLGSHRWAATTTDAGDILTANAHPNPAGNSTWIVRKLTCIP